MVCGAQLDHEQVPNFGTRPGVGFRHPEKLASSLKTLLDKAVGKFELGFLGMGEVHLELVAQCHQLIYSGEDAVLFGEGRERYFDSTQCLPVDIVLRSPSRSFGQLIPIWDWGPTENRLL